MTDLQKHNIVIIPQFKKLKNICITILRPPSESTLLDGPVVVSRRNKCDHYTIIKFPVTTRSAMRKAEAPVHTCAHRGGQSQ